MRARGPILVGVIAAAAAFVALAPEGDATLENQVFTSRAHRIRVSVPRGWRASDQSSYPGVLLWMRRSKPPGMMLLTSEAIDDTIYCAWPAQCRQLADTLAAQYACALASRLEGMGFRVGPVQAGPRDGELPSVWLEYDDGKRWLRQAVASDDVLAHTLILSAGSAQQRAGHARSFDQALRSVHPLADDEIEPPAPVDARPADADPAAPPPPDAAPAAGSAAAPAPAPALPAPTAVPRGLLTRRCPRNK
jgi:hypothetical protein